jgi:restriction system protein
MTALEAIETVLSEAGQPLDCKTITQRVLEKQLWKTNAQDPEQSIAAYLSVDIKYKGEQSRFQRTAPGTFALRSWGLPEVASRAIKKEATLTVPPAEPTPVTMSFADAAELILSQSIDRKPMHYKAITERALEMDLVSSSGQTPAATLNAIISIAIAQAAKRGESPKFTRPGRGLIGLSTWESDSLAVQIERHNAEVKAALHYRLATMNPAEFEALVGRLLVALGFEEVEVTQRSGDGGIDVRGTLVVGDVIRTRMAVQVKRWKQNVQAPTVQQVRGSLGTHEQGLIITTGDFSSGARQEAQRANAVPVALMSGAQLVNLLVEHDIEVRKATHYLIELGQADDEGAQA